MPNTPPDRYYIIHELSGTQEGPLTKPQIHQLILKRKLKRNSKIGVAGREGVVPAKDLFSKAFAAAEQKQRQQAASAKKEKADAKAEAKAAKLAQREKRAVEKSESKSADSGDNPWMPVLKSSRKTGDGEIKYRGFEFQRAVLTVIMYFVILGGLLATIAALVTMGYGFMSPGNGGVMVIKVLLGVGQLVSAILGTALAVGSILFFRNLIDWMVDVERNTRK